MADIYFRKRDNMTSRPNSADSIKPRQLEDAQVQQSQQAQQVQQIQQVQVQVQVQQPQQQQVQQQDNAIKNCSKKLVGKKDLENVKEELKNNIKDNMAVVCSMLTTASAIDKKIDDCKNENKAVNDALYNKLLELNSRIEVIEQSMPDS